MKRVVVKVGTSTLSTPEGCLNREIIARLSDEIAAAREDGIEIALVTSGAVGAGSDRLRIQRPRAIPQKQAAAAIGQGILMGVYASCFDERGLTAAQILLTRQDVADRARYTNARNTFDAVFRYGAVPVVNENDSVAVDEIRFGDNDTLAAMVALIVDADLVVILSDVPGLHDPAAEPRTTISCIPEVTGAVENMARPARSGSGTGGMITKLRAGRILTRAGIAMIIAYGGESENLRGAIRRWVCWERENVDPGEPGTLFLPAPRRLQGRKRWIAFGSRARGALVIHPRAKSALLEDGRSLLAAGVMEATGPFQAGDLVRILDSEGREVGRGLVNFSLEEVRMICGRQSGELNRLLGREATGEVVHRDNLVIGL